MENLSPDELHGLVQSVFEPSDDERLVMIMVDLPDAVVPDNPDWADRRQVAASWARTLASGSRYEVILAVYRNPRMNNAQLPATAWVIQPDKLPATADVMDESAAVSFDSLFSRLPLILAPTEFSATAPLKLVARQTGIRGATMPGFCRAMMDALRLDYVEVNRRVGVMADLLDVATGSDFEFLVSHADGRLEPMSLHLDLRHRQAHRSGGRFPQSGQVGNLPSGEAYIVPYEGEVNGDPSGSNGLMPVQFGDEVVVYAIVGNRAVSVIGNGPAAAAEREHLSSEPAYGNLAELGVGVLGDFGVRPLGEILIDEKLGLHIAFGRSDHFGGQVGPGSFSRPEAVIHIDRVYIPEMQPRVKVVRATLRIPGSPDVEMVSDDRWVFSF